MTEKTLVAYFSYSNGNTRRIAEAVRTAMHAEIAEIKPVHPYTGTYEEVVEQAQQEVNRGFQPAIQPLPVSLADYDTVVIGTPTWWYTMAPAVLTFLTANDWSGKTVIPFMTNAGWPGHVIQDMKKACRGAVIKDEKEIRFDGSGGDQMITSEAELNTWLAELKR